MALCDIAKDYGLERVFVHCFMDGRDTDPESGKGFVNTVAEHCKQSAGTVATVIGRYYAMDRNNNWDRIKVAYDMLTAGVGKPSDDMVRAIQESYDEGVTDEFIKPIVNSTVDGRIQEGDVVIFFNFRNDRAKQITIALTQQDKPEDGMKVIPGLQYYCMTPYDPTFKDVHVLFPKENVPGQPGQAPAAHRRNGKICPRDILLQRRTRAALRERGPHPGSLARRGHL